MCRRFNITDEMQPSPRMKDFLIFSNGIQTLIFKNWFLLSHQAKEIWCCNNSITLGMIEIQSIKLISITAKTLG
jgi:hypothetical protein